QNVTDCPDGTSPSTNTSQDCTGHLAPSGTLVLPLPCSAVALDACVTPTSTLFDTGALNETPPGGAPLAIVPATPPTWASGVSTPGDYVALTDGTMRLVTSSSAPPTVI